MHTESSKCTEMAAFCKAMAFWLLLTMGLTLLGRGATVQRDGRNKVHLTCNATTIYIAGMCVVLQYHFH